MFYHLAPDEFSDVCIGTDPALPGEIDFISGQWIDLRADPLEFESSYRADQPPKHFDYCTIPVMSQALLAVLARLGVDVLQTFPAVIVNRRRKLRWDGYLAANILGIVACADVARSEHTPIGTWPNGLLMGDFTNLIIDPARAGRHELFRLAESPHMIIAAERIVDGLLDEFGDEETIGMTITALDGSAGDEDDDGEED